MDRIENRIVKVHFPKRPDGSWMVLSGRALMDNPHERKTLIETRKGPRWFDRSMVRQGWER